ncbi:hypothetical protein POSPLADRAFT_1055873 [Postia placenta MAD-698-R-SB12]|uniref:Uncharacterized protein n=1 Tax=Postia placenta MAD-698-R-SB12 TaxID=670580 RepID=A0A1X6N599_9APHY|nr:hypothetical protein POSPLADRAFT_1055873 [Postia placenta MAD-698-R-SB12]OSX63791.1 hypothetical protein POSPLADRAFT_1055873 [Postia placenta MAD-698-R-SB12]
MSAPPFWRPGPSARPLLAARLLLSTRRTSSALSVPVLRPRVWAAECAPSIVRSLSPWRRREACGRSLSAHQTWGLLPWHLSYQNPCALAATAHDACLVKPSLLCSAAALLREPASTPPSAEPPCPSLHPHLSPNGRRGSSCALGHAARHHLSREHRPLLLPSPRAAPPHVSRPTSHPSRLVALSDVRILRHTAGTNQAVPAIRTRPYSPAPFRILVAFWRDLLIRPTPSHPHIRQPPPRSAAGIPAIRTAQVRPQPRVVYAARPVFSPADVIARPAKHY